MALKEGLSIARASRSIRQEHPHMPGPDHGRSRGIGI